MSEPTDSGEKGHRQPDADVSKPDAEATRPGADATQPDAEATRPGADASRSDVDGDTRTVAVPEQTALALETRIEKTDFESIDAYVAAALDRLLLELDRQEDPSHDDRRSDIDRDTSGGDGVESHLESLGYL